MKAFESINVEDPNEELRSRILADGHIDLVDQPAMYMYHETRQLSQAASVSSAYAIGSKQI